MVCRIIIYAFLGFFFIGKNYSNDVRYGTKIVWKKEKKAISYELEIYSKKKSSALLGRFKTFENFHYWVHKSSIEQVYVRVRYQVQGGRQSPFSRLRKISLRKKMLTRPSKLISPKDGLVFKNKSNAFAPVSFQWKGLKSKESYRFRITDRDGNLIKQLNLKSEKVDLNLETGKYTWDVLTIFPNGNQEESEKYEFEIKGLKKRDIASVAELTKERKNLPFNDKTVIGLELGYVNGGAKLQTENFNYSEVTGQTMTYVAVTITGTLFESQGYTIKTGTTQSSEISTQHIKGLYYPLSLGYQGNSVVSIGLGYYGGAVKVSSGQDSGSVSFGMYLAGIKFDQKISRKLSMGSNLQFGERTTGKTSSNYFSVDVEGHRKVGKSSHLIFGVERKTLDYEQTDVEYINSEYRLKLGLEWGF